MSVHFVFDSSNYQADGYNFDGQAEVLSSTSNDVPQLSLDDTSMGTELGLDVTLLVNEGAPNPFFLERVGENFCGIIGATTIGDECFSSVDLANPIGIVVQCDPNAVDNVPGLYTASLKVVEATPALVSSSIVTTVRCNIQPKVAMPTAITADDDVPDVEPGPGTVVTVTGAPGTDFYVELQDAPGWTMEPDCSSPFGNPCRLPSTAEEVSLLDVAELPITFRYFAESSTPGDEGATTVEIRSCDDGCQTSFDQLGTIELRAHSHGGTVTPPDGGVELPSLVPSRTSASLAVPLRNFGDRTVGFDVFLEEDGAPAGLFALTDGDDVEDGAFHVIAPDDGVTAPVTVACDRVAAQAGPGNYQAHLTIFGSTGPDGTTLPPYDPATPPPPSAFTFGGDPPESVRVDLACRVSDLEVSPEVLDFRTLKAPLVADSDPIEVTLTNAGAAAIDVSAIAIADADESTVLELQATDDIATLAPGASATFDVVVKQGSALGPLSGKVTFSSHEGSADVAWALPVTGVVRDDLGPIGEDGDDEGGRSYYACSTSGGTAGGGAVSLVTVGLALALGSRRRRSSARRS